MKQKIIQEKIRMNKHLALLIWILIVILQPYMAKAVVTVVNAVENSQVKYDISDEAQYAEYEKELEKASETPEIKEEDIEKKAEELTQERLLAAKEIYNQQLKQLEAEKAKLPADSVWNQLRANIDKQKADLDKQYQEDISRIKNSRAEILEDAKNEILFQMENNGMGYE